MEQRNYLKLIWLIGFIAFATVSCWATAESLHLLMPSWPAVMCWIVTVGFFVIASLGTKMIVDSLNQNIYLDKRPTYLIGGIMIVLVFWLVCSMPTNTHTFFYRNVIGDVASTEISRTRGYLQQLQNNALMEQKILEKQNTVEMNVKAKLAELELEIKNDANPGFGPKSRQLLNELASQDMLDVPKIEPFSYRGTSAQERTTLTNMYRQKVYGLLDIRKQKIRDSFASASETTYKREAAEGVKRLDELETGIKEEQFDLNDTKNIAQLNQALVKAYATINTYQQYVKFNTKEEKAEYTKAEPVTKVKKMISVIDVWKDFIGGQYSGRGFIFWVIISVLVDIAAFMFFDLAFKKQD